MQGCLEEVAREGGREGLDPTRFAVMEPRSQAREPGNEAMSGRAPSLEDDRNSRYIYLAHTVSLTRP